MPTQNTWTIKDILDWCEGFLANKGSHSARHDAQYLLGEAMGLSRIELYTNFDKPLSQAERATMRDWVARRAAGEPLQLICGTAPFRHMVLKVAPGVLIPRPETEVLVSEVLALFPPPKQVSAFAFEGEARGGVESAGIADAATEAAEAAEVSEPGEAAEAPEPAEPAEVSEPGEAAEVSEPAEPAEVSEPAEAAEEAEAAAIRVIDLCTGSGCIACALATEHPLMEVVATDIAPEALALAARNAHAQGVADRIQFVESSLLSALMQDPKNRGAFDAIVSNPPYVPSGVVETLNPEVADFEPRLALDGGADGLDLYRAFIADAHILLKPSGILAVELFETTLEDASCIACAHEFENPRIVQDLAGKPRILLAYKA